MMKKVGRKRADELVVSLGLCESRTQAQAYILAGKVRMGTERIDKSSRLLPADSVLSLEQAQRFVGRGGLKMQNFLKETKTSAKGLDILDLGASTGGFTDCLLQEGAVSATCVDVGHGQLHYKLRTDPRVTNYEKTNLRHLTAQSLDQPFFDLVVMDLSFISLRKVLPQAWSFVRETGKMIALVKPQFECARKEADQGRGVISDPQIQQRTLREIKVFAESELAGSELFAETESSPRGADGNLEFFLGWIRREG
jgi:23S rRNA (cytidine1920-2'-O)/16S rRNA (cytidine1409-2'-O)-methyltransferase